MTTKVAKKEDLPVVAQDIRVDEILRREIVRAVTWGSKACEPVSPECVFPLVRSVLALQEGASLFLGRKNGPAPRSRASSKNPQAAAREFYLFMELHTDTVHMSWRNALAGAFPCVLLPD